VATIFIPCLAALELNATSNQHDSLFATYMPVNKQYDEFRSNDGTVRPVWRSIIDSFNQMGHDGLQSVSAEVDRLVEESGANFHVSSTRPWQLAVMPLVIDATMWAKLDQGLQQRVRVLEAVLADLLGPQRLLKERVLPAELLSANPDYSRVYHELPSFGHRLSLTAADLARDRDGSWWVTVVCFRN
jgi:uncharacterized circularly permuted ATP-grasp superfamily protein